MRGFPDVKSIVEGVLFGFTKKQLLIVLGIIALTSGTAVAATVVTLTFTPVSGAQGTLETADLQVDSSTLQYSGVNVTQVDVVVTNTGSTSHSGDVFVTVNTASGATTTSNTVSSLASGSSTTITVDITDTSMANFNGVDVRIEQTG